VKPVISYDAVFTKKDDKAVFFLLHPCINEESDIGYDRFLHSELGGVFTKVRVDEDIPIELFMDSIGRAERGKNLALGGRSDRDSFRRVSLDLRTDMDSSDGATARQGSQKNP
jgi:hypothetical protein